MFGFAEIVDCAMPFNQDFAGVMQARKMV